jgi:hypothetical protein
MEWRDCRRPGENDEPAPGGTGWVRLVPAPGPEFADVAGVPLRRDARGRPLSDDREVDRKLVAAFDLMTDTTTPPRLRTSERFVRALEKERVAGWRACIVPHVTPNSVSGHRIYDVEFDGWIGPFVDTKIEFSVPQPEFPDEQPNGLPFDPATFDGSRATGHPIAWSSWCGIRQSSWRALICQESLFARLQERLGHLRCGAVTSVNVRRWRAGEWIEPGRIERDDGPPMVWTAASVIARVRFGAKRYSHELAVRVPDKEEVASVFRVLGIREVADVVAIYCKLGGSSLFGKALRLFPPRADALYAERQEAVDIDCYSFDEGVVPIAEGADRVVWGLLPDGRIRGYAEEGGVYGPDVGCIAWLGDQVADLEYACDHPRKTRWAIRTLGL